MDRGETPRHRPWRLAWAPPATQIRRWLARAPCLCEDLRIDSEPGARTRVRLVFNTFPSTFEDEMPRDLSELDYVEAAASRRLVEAVEEQSEELLNLPPALAVSVGRLLAGLPREHNARTALWG